MAPAVLPLTTPVKYWFGQDRKRGRCGTRCSGTGRQGGEHQRYEQDQGTKPKPHSTSGMHSARQSRNANVYIMFITVMMAGH
jgi:hypothetical protein